MRSTFRVLFYVKKGSARPNGDLPLMCRLTVDGEVKQFSCKMDVPPRLWDVKNGRATGKSVEAMQINLAVDKIRVEVNRRYQELMQSDGYVTAAKLRDAYLGIGVKQETLLKLFEQHNVEYRKKVGFNREVATWKKYCCVCKRVREFLAHTYHREDIPLKELNLTFINDFEYFLRTEKKCRTNTVWGYMIVLKHIVAIARNDGRLPFNPFSGYINSPESVDRGYLSQEEIKAVMNYKTANKAHARIRDLFVFSIFTGLAYADVKGLTTDNLQTMFDGNLWIITRRKKTNTESRIRLLDLIPEVIELLNSEEINISQALELCRYEKEIQREVYDGYFKMGLDCHWRHLRAKELRSRLAGMYLSQLDSYRFDKTECMSCASNRANQVLFADCGDCNVCQNRACMKRKNTEYLIAEAKRLLSE